MQPCERVQQSAVTGAAAPGAKGADPVTGDGVSVSYETNVTKPAAGRARTVSANRRRRESGVSVRQVKAARALLGWTQKDLAAVSGVGAPNIARIEAQGGELRASANTGRAIFEAFDRAGVLFFRSEAGEGVTVRPQP